MKALEVMRSPSISAARDLALQRHLLAQVRRRADLAQGVLHLGRLTGDAVTVGRYQRAASAVRDPARALRRPTGGRAARMSEGILSLSLVLPDASALLPRGSGAIGPEKIVNRYVRGLLGGLQWFGLKAYYFGRDFLSINRRHGGYLSFEVGPGGETLFHALVAITRPTTLAIEEQAYPGLGGNRPDPDPTSVADELGRALDVEDLEAAIVETYARQQGLETRARELTPLEDTLLREREAAGHSESDGDAISEASWGRSELKPIANGYLEAAAQVVQQHFLGAVRLHGDFMSGSGAIERLERELRLVPIDWREVGIVVDRVLAASGGGIVGVRYLRVIPDAVLEAAGRVESSSPGV